MELIAYSNNKKEKLDKITLFNGRGLTTTRSFVLVKDE
jgi:hypothetical protein